MASLHNSRINCFNEYLFAEVKRHEKNRYLICRVTLNELWNWLESELKLFGTLRTKFVTPFLDVLGMPNFLPTSNTLNGWLRDLCYIKQKVATRKTKLYCKMYRLFCECETFNSLCSCLRERTRNKTFAFLVSLQTCSQTPTLIYSDQYTSTDIFNPSLKEFVWIFLFMVINTSNEVLTKGEVERLLSVVNKICM